MVDKTKRALAILQKRGCTSPGNSVNANNNTVLANGVVHGIVNNGTSQTQHSDNNTGINNPQDREGTFKRLSGEIVAQTIRATEDRVAEVKRRAGEFDSTIVLFFNIIFKITYVFY